MRHQHPRRGVEGGAQFAHVVPARVPVGAVAAALGDQQVRALGEGAHGLDVRRVAGVGDDAARVPHAEAERLDVVSVLHRHALDVQPGPLEGRAARLLEPAHARVVALRQPVRRPDHLAQPLVDARRPGDGERPFARGALASLAAHGRLQQEQVDAADVVGVLVREQHEVDRLRGDAELEQVRQRLRRAVEQHPPVEQEPAPVAPVREREARAQAVEAQFRHPLADPRRSLRGAHALPYPIANHGSLVSCAAR